MHKFTMSLLDDIEHLYDIQRDLIEAIFTSDIDTIELCLKQGANPKEAFEDGNSKSCFTVACEKACDNDQIDILEVYRQHVDVSDIVRAFIACRGTNGSNTDRVCTWLSEQGIAAASALTVARLTGWLADDLVALRPDMESRGLVLAGGLPCRAVLSTVHGLSDKEAMDGADADFFWIRSVGAVPDEINIAELCERVGATYYKSSNRVATMHTVGKSLALQFVAGADDTVKAFGQKADIAVAGFVFYWDRAAGAFALHGPPAAWKAVFTRTMPLIDPELARYGTPQRIVKYARAPFSFDIRLAHRLEIYGAKAPLYPCHEGYNRGYTSGVHAPFITRFDCYDDVELLLLAKVVLDFGGHTLRIGPLSRIKRVDAEKARDWADLYRRNRWGLLHPDLIESMRRAHYGKLAVQLNWCVDRYHSKYREARRHVISMSARDEMFPSAPRVTDYVKYMLADRDAEGPHDKEK